MKTARTLFLGAIVCLAVPACADVPAKESTAPSVDLSSEDSKTLYALGLAMSRGLIQLGITPEEFALVRQGLEDGTLKRETKVNLDEYAAKIQQFGQKRVSAAMEIEKKDSAAFVDKMAAEAGAVRTESGLVISEITPGTGPSPTASDRVKVHYRGSLRDGTVFDSSIDRGEPVTFGLNRVIKCWTEGVQRMKVGGKSRLVCPSSIAYGDAGAPPKIPGGAALVFEVELLGIEAPEAPPAPPLPGGGSR